MALNVVLRATGACGFLVGMVLFAGGCATRQATYERVHLPGVTREKAYDAARSVLERHFEIADADAAAGTIDTHYRVREVEGGLSRFPRAFLNLDHIPDELFTHRRRAKAMVRSENDGSAVSLMVQKERLYTEAGAGPSLEREYDPVSSANPTGFGGKAWETEETWSPVGSDRAMERALLREIAEKLGVEETATTNE